jgi:hypothetical protein
MMHRNKFMQTLIITNKTSQIINIKIENNVITL